MIDLGDELADYGDEPKRPAVFDGDGFPVGRNGSDVRVGPNGMRTFGKLADLQKGGFNVNPRTGRGIGTPSRGFGDPHRDVGDPPAKITFTPPDPLTDDSRWTFAGMIDDDSLKINVKTWFGDDMLKLDYKACFGDEPVPTSDSRTITVQIGGGTNPLIDALRSDKPLVDIVVPDQPFDWTPQVTATHRGKPINPVCTHGRMIWSCWQCVDRMT